MCRRFAIGQPRIAVVLPTQRSELHVREERLEFGMRHQSVRGQLIAP